MVDIMRICHIQNLIFYYKNSEKSTSNTPRRNINTANLVDEKRVCPLFSPPKKKEGRYLALLSMNHKKIILDYWLFKIIRPVGADGGLGDPSPLTTYIDEKAW
jgi:hypothetical protein